MNTDYGREANYTLTVIQPVEIGQYCLDCGRGEDTILPVGTQIRITREFMNREHGLVYAIGDVVGWDELGLHEAEVSIDADQMDCFRRDE